MPGHVLTINVGSSSVKTAVFTNADDMVRTATANVSGIGTPKGSLEVRRLGAEVERHPVQAASHADGLDAALAELGPWTSDLEAVVHRVVHGGAGHAEPVWIGPALVADLETLTPFAPDHLPPALAAIALAERRFPHVGQAACFDTAFHRDLPLVARMYPLPRRYFDSGVRRYGFHGLSSESAMHALAALDPVAAAGRIVIAHLGNGASLTAVHNGRSVDTTMGFSPMGGVMMGTRTGDLDPGVLLYAMAREGLDGAAIGHLVSEEAGLLGVSGRSRDMRDLLAHEASDPAAREAVALFCYQGRKALGGLVAVLGGLDTLVFTGGIGERAAPVRARMLAGLEALGVRLDVARNDANAGVISAVEAAVTVRIISADEEGVMARHVRSLLREVPR